MAASTSPAFIPPDLAAEVIALRDRVAVLEERLPAPVDASAIQALVDTMAADIAEIAKMIRPAPRTLEETEARMREVDGDPAHDAAFERLLNTPVDGNGQLIRVGARVTFSSGLGKGLEVGMVAGVEEHADGVLVVIDDGTATAWKRASNKVVVLPAGFGR